MFLRVLVIFQFFIGGVGVLRLPIVKEGFPFIGIGVVITFLLGYFVHPVVAVFPAVLTLFLRIFSAIHVVIFHKEKIF